jgi:hypothetical protein
MREKDMMPILCFNWVGSASLSSSLLHEKDIYNKAKTLIINIITGIIINIIILI